MSNYTVAKYLNLKIIINIIIVAFLYHYNIAIYYIHYQYIDFC
jgi:hypothetical protein